MKTRPEGYTILEALVFLAISGILFAVIYPTFIGRDNTERFSQSVRDLENKINDVVNDVSTGYFPASENDCKDNGAGNKLVITGNNGVQGANRECVFLGKALRFDADPDKPVMDIITVVGKKDAGDGASTNLVADSIPAAVTKASGYGSVNDITEEYLPKWSVPFESVQYIPSVGGELPTAGVAFILNLNGSSSTSNTKNTDIYNIEDSIFGDSREDTADYINDSSWSQKGKFVVCMVSPYNSNQKAAIVIDNSNATVARSLFDDNIEAELGSGIC